jgi:aromatic-L-amino-acid/L-tryptophan decarboxylase
MTRPLNLPDREKALAHAAEIIASAWKQFDRARELEPELDEPISHLLTQPLPRYGIDAIAGLDEAAGVLDASIAQARPRYFAYIGSSALEIGALADLLAHSYDVNLALDSKAATLLEEQAIRWLAEFVGFPASSGNFTSGGQISNMTALAAAREAALPGSRITGMSGIRARIYASAEAHYSNVRAAEVLGIGAANVVAIPIDENRRMRTDLLALAIDADIAAGFTPVAVVATGGTTLTGTVDPLGAIVEVAHERGVWVHVDGAYGLPAAGTKSRRSLFEGIEAVDSVSIDAHKWLYVPKACSAVMIRDPKILAETFGHHEAYMPHEDAVRPNMVDTTLEYSRPFRALKLWLAFRVHGAEGIREALEANLEQAQLTYALATAHDEFEVLPSPPSLSIAPIRHVLPNCPDLDAHNDALYKAMQRNGRVFVSPGTIDGRTWLRPCFTNYRTTTDDVHVLLDVASEIGTAICPEH